MENLSGIADYTYNSRLPISTNYTFFNHTTSLQETQFRNTPNLTRALCVGPEDFFLSETRQGLFVS